MGSDEEMLNLLREIRDLQRELVSVSVSHFERYEKKYQEWVDEARRNHQESMQCWDDLREEWKVDREARQVGVEANEAWREASEASKKANEEWLGAIRRQNSLGRFLLAMIISLAFILIGIITIIKIIL